MFLRGVSQSGEEHSKDDQYSSEPLQTTRRSSKFQTRLGEFRDWTLSGLNGSEREKGGVGAGKGRREGEVVARQLSKRGAISMWQI